jgi:hypothetical protein
MVSKVYDFSLKKAIGPLNFNTNTLEKSDNAKKFTDKQKMNEEDDYDE